MLHERRPGVASGSYATGTRTAPGLDTQMRRAELGHTSRDESVGRMPKIHPKSLFAHPRLAPLRSEMMITPTGRGIVSKLDRLPVTVQSEFPKNMPFSSEAAAAYDPTRNIMYVPDASIDEPGEAMITLLHEGMHRIQRGSDFHAKLLARTSGVRYAASGMREAITDIGQGRGTVGDRFNRGAMNAAIRNETEAYLVNYQVMKDLKATPAAGNAFFGEMAKREAQLGRVLRPDDIADLVIPASTNYQARAAFGVVAARDAVTMTALYGGSVAAVTGATLAVDRYVQPFIDWPNGRNPMPAWRSEAG